jgi:hypothetical protein
LLSAMAYRMRVETDVVVGRNEISQYFSVTEECPLRFRMIARKTKESWIAMFNVLLHSMSERVVSAVEKEPMRLKISVGS